MDVAADEFVKRLPENATAARELILAAFKFPDAVRAKADQIRADKYLSDIGKSEALGKLISEGGMAEHFGQVKAQARQWHADLAVAKENLKPQAPDKGDLAAIMQASEIRSYLRSLPDAQRTRAALEEPGFESAITHAPPALSGLSGDVHGLVVQASIERQLGPQLAAFKERERIVETVNSAVAVVEGRLRREVESK